jgi:hypothetical protein
LKKAVFVFVCGHFGKSKREISRKHFNNLKSGQRKGMIEDMIEKKASA